jgi:hypothetical protein
MRQFLFSGTILSSLAAGISLLRKTGRGPFTWQVALLWASWIISMALAIAAIRDRNRV